jgi:DNA-binding response OmpR family regulator
VDDAIVSTRTILIVDDDAKIRLMLRRCFEGEGYTVLEAATGAEVHEHLADNVIDLITLDLNLGNEDGLMIARDIRKLSEVPIIMVTGKGDMIDKIVGLELGADDYISKPFHLREVLARVRSVLRRSGADGAEQPKAAQQKPEGDCYQFEGWVLDLGRRELRTKDGSVCDLTTGEFNLLAMLSQRPQRVLSRDQIMDLTKGNDWNPLDRSIDNQIVRLRKKIEADPKNPRIIKTVRGAGYCFTANPTKA